MAHSGQIRRNQPVSPDGFARSVLVYPSPAWQRCSIPAAPVIPAYARNRCRLAVGPCLHGKQWPCSELTDRKDGRAIFPQQFRTTQLGQINNGRRFHDVRAQALQQFGSGQHGAARRNQIIHQ